MKRYKLDAHGKWGLTRRGPMYANLRCQECGRRVDVLWNGAMVHHDDGTRICGIARQLSLWDTDQGGSSST